MRVVLNSPRRRRALALAVGLASAVAVLVVVPVVRAAAPVVSLNPVSELRFTEAKVSGEVDPQGVSTAWSLQYIADPAYQQNVAESKPPFEGARVAKEGVTSTPEAVAAALQGLLPNTAYHVRLVASSTEGTVQALAAVFTPPFGTPTGSSAPVLVTGGADHLTGVRGQLHGTVNQEGEATVYWFEYGPGDCGSGPCESAPAARDAFSPGVDTAASTPFSVAQQLGGLEPGTTYHYRLVARNSFGTGFGSDRTFTTPPAPAPAGECANEALRVEQHAGFLGDCRAFELVSPPEKDGGYVIPDYSRTRAAADGEAVGFTSLGAFAGAEGTGVGTDYLAERQAGPGPLGTGWVTHAITPPQQPNSLDGLVQLLEPHYVGEFTADLGEGVFLADRPLSGEEPGNVENVPNLYLRTDLRASGPGHYRLLSACPQCAAPEGKPLKKPEGLIPSSLAKPLLAELSSDGSQALIESDQRLTSDTPSNGKPHAFEWDEGVLRLAGRIPPGTATECDDTSTPACTPAAASVAGQGQTFISGISQLLHVHTLSDGSDGHARAFFTFPTANGTSANPADESGNLYVREDGHRTIKLNTPNPGVPASGFVPAKFWDASTDGERAFFTTRQALTKDAGTELTKLYMWSSTPDPSGGHVTLLAPEEGLNGEPATVSGVVGASADGSYVYFITVEKGNLVAATALGTGGVPNIYVWHEGTISYVAPIRASSESALFSQGTNPFETPRVARVSSDGRHLLLFSDEAVGPTGYDQFSACPDASGAGGCKELYLYSAASSAPSEPDVRCVSCRPDLAPATQDATDVVRAFQGDSMVDVHQTAALSVDGRFVFFSTPEALVPGDTNGVEDAYEYDTQSEEVHLLSSGQSPEPSWFLDASADGHDVFFVTAQPLVGWDHDTAFDLYDARIGGGLPEPEPAAAPCGGPSCRGALAHAPAQLEFGSGLAASGNAPLAPVPPSAGPAKPKPKRKRHCPKGRHVKRVHHRTVCVSKRKRAHGTLRSSR
jgi:hypothetical protein